jgi:hypothetical protein
MTRLSPLLPALFSLTLFLSAFLLFLVQPMVGKMVLPLLGGTPAVWNTCMVFFQAALLAGYAYAHAGPLWLGLRAHAALHLGLLALALLMLPLALPPGLDPPRQSSPVLWLLGLLLLTTGLPFFLAAASGPLLQRWFASTRHLSAADPYFLYGASNLGSLLALLAYPALVEPNWPLPEQGLLWALGYASLVVLTCVCALCACTVPPSLARPSPAVAPVEGEAPTTGRKARWVLMAFLPSSLMLSVTTYLTTDIAPIPLLWVVPLGLYLLTFILVFAPRQLLSPRAFRRGLPVAVVLVLLALLSEATEPLWLLLGVHLLGLFVVAMACHGELARDRPPAAHLTGFYLWLSVGGVLGGAFNVLLAPLLFPGVAEYPLALVLTCLALARPGARVARADVALPVALGLLTVALVLFGRVLVFPAASAHVEAMMRFGVMFALPVLVCYTFAGRPVRFGLGVGAVLVAGLLAPSVHGTIIHQERSFFGVHRVAVDPTGTFRVLVHGNTVHGRERINRTGPAEPLAYYHREGPAGRVFAAFAKRRPAGRVALVGLGAGALAAHGRSGQEFTFYEIDPAVIHIARTYFSFLREAQADCTVVAGDARLTLADAPEGYYDLLVLDAFTSDAIPTHLLTREALALYLSRLKKDGVLCFHISNRYLRLGPVLADLAADAKLLCRMREDLFLSREQLAGGRSPSVWVVLARRPEDLGELATNSFWVRVGPRPGKAVWTDGFSDLLGAFPWGE